MTYLQLSAQNAAQAKNVTKFFFYFTAIFTKVYEHKCHGVRQFLSIKRYVHTCKVQKGVEKL